MSMPSLKSGSNYTITNVNTTAVLFYDNISNRVLGYFGTSQQWTATQLESPSKDGSEWEFSTSGVNMGYQYPDENSIIIGVAQDTSFGISPAPTNGQYTDTLTISVPTSGLCLQPAIPDPVPGIATILSECDPSSNLQRWNFLEL